MPHRSYDHYCAISRALDVVGDRWTLLIVRELLLGPRRYSDLLADLPGISTDVLAARLREMERDGTAARRRADTRVSTWHYELTPDGERLRGVLEALGAWGGRRLGARRPTDALRGHWFAVPLGQLLAELLAATHEPAITARQGQRAPGTPSAEAMADTRCQGTIEVRLDEGGFQLRLGPGHVIERVASGEAATVTLHTDSTTAADLVARRLDLATALATDRLRVTGESPLADSLRRGTRVPAPTPAST